MKYAALVAALLALSATGALADDPLPKVTFGEPGYGGTGCPAYFTSSGLGSNRST